MRLTKGQLKRIIREEYSNLKRQGLIKENRTLHENKNWQLNPRMGRVDNQTFKEGMPIRLAVNFALDWLVTDFGQDILLNIAEICKTGEDVINLANGNTDEGAAIAYTLKSGTLNGTGNYDYYAFADEIARQLKKMGV